MKKTLAILLSLALIICMMPATAFAETTQPVQTPDYDLSKAKVELSQESFVYDGTEQKPTVKVTDATGNVVPTDKYTVAYTNNTNVGSESAKPTVTVTGIGTSGGTEYYGTVTKQFTITALDLSSTDVKIEEKTPIVSETVTDSNITVTYNSKVISSGFTVAAAVSPGDKTTILVTITANAGQNNLTGTQTEAFYIRKDLSAYTVTASTGHVYNGQAIKPTLSFKNGSTSVTLYEGTDYTVSFSDNVNAKNSPCAITVVGIGKYTGTAHGSFIINPKQISSSGVKIEIPNVAQNERISPIVKDGEKTLVEGADYTFVEPDTSTAGSRNLVITGIGNYTGTKQASYNVIDSKKVFGSGNVTFSPITPYYKGTRQYQTITVKMNDNSSPLREGIDYKVEYTKDGKTTSYAEDAGTYRVTVTGIGSYSGSATGSFTINKVPLDYAKIVLGSSTVLQNGVYVPKVSVQHIDGSFYFKETDYKVEYRNVNSSYYYSKPTVIVTPTANGNLTTGITTTQLKKEFSLASRSIYNCIVDFTDYRSSKAYDGATTFQPSVTVKDTSINRTLIKGADYTVTYKNAAGEPVYYLKDAGTYQVIITGTGAYSGTKTLTYTITGTDISRYTVTLRESSVQADGYGRVPVISSVKNGYYSSLSTNDYTVSYEDPDGKKVTSLVTPGTYKVIVTGKNGYMGSTYANFRIIGIPQTLTIEKTAYKVYEDSDSFKITARATGDGTGFKYTSNDTSVATVSATGVVTMHKVGRAVITVTTIGNKKSEPASDEVYVKVYPDKGYITKKPWNSGKKAQMQVRWQYQKGVTKYQIKYSTTKTFKNYDVKTVKAHGKDYTTQSTTIKKLKSGKQYYFKVRPVYETYNEKGTKITYFGKWSNWRSAKVK